MRSTYPTQSDGTAELAVASPLAGFELFRGRGMEGVERSIASLYSSPEGAGRFQTAQGESMGNRTSSVRGVRLTHLTLLHLRLGAEAQLSIPRQHAYHLAFVSRGEVKCYFGARRVRMAPGRVVITRPNETSMIPSWGEGIGAVCMQIHPGALEDELSALLGRPVGLPTFQDDLDLLTGPGRSWSGALALLFRGLSDADGLARQSRSYTGQLERLLLSSMLRALPHEYSAELLGDARPARWSSVRRAISAMEETPERAWTLADISAVAGVGGRRLQQGFGEQIGMPPMMFLQSVRLERVRHDLLNGGESIGQSAARWGFSHPGRFSAAYRVRYGETPRETQRRSKPIVFGRLTA